MPGHLGVERTWEVAETALVPDLSGLPEVASVDRPRELESVSVYYDTETYPAPSRHLPAALHRKRGRGLASRTGA